MSMFYTPPPPIDMARRFASGLRTGIQGAAAGLAASQANTSRERVRGARRAASSGNGMTPRQAATRAGLDQAAGRVRVNDVLQQGLANNGILPRAQELIMAPRRGEQVVPPTARGELERALSSVPPETHLAIMQSLGNGRSGQALGAVTGQGTGFQTLVNVLNAAARGSAAVGSAARAVGSGAAQAGDTMGRRFSNMVPPMVGRSSPTAAAAGGAGVAGLAGMAGARLGEQPQQDPSGGDMRTRLQADKIQLLDQQRDLQRALRDARLEGRPMRVRQITDELNDLRRTGRQIEMAMTRVNSMEDPRSPTQQAGEFIGAARAAFGGRAADLTAQAMAAREAGNEARATELERRAQQERSRGRAFTPSNMTVFDRPDPGSPLLAAARDGSLSEAAAARADAARRLIEGVGGTGADAIAGPEGQTNDRAAILDDLDFRRRVAENEAQIRAFSQIGVPPPLSETDRIAQDVQRMQAEAQRRRAMLGEGLDIESRSPEFLEVFTNEMAGLLSSLQVDDVRVDTNDDRNNAAQFQRAVDELERLQRENEPVFNELRNQLRDRLRGPLSPTANIRERDSARAGGYGDVVKAAVTPFGIPRLIGGALSGENREFLQNRQRLAQLLGLAEQ